MNVPNTADPLEARLQLVAKIIDRVLVYDDEIIAVVLHGNFAVVLGQNQTAPALVADAVSDVLQTQGITTTLDSSKCGSDGVRSRAGLVIFAVWNDVFPRTLEGVLARRAA
jgi:hypothetical protein